jgi:hypothetical protein
MNNYLIKWRKQRDMRNEVNEIENNSRRTKHKWRYVVLTAVFTMSVMIFFINELFIENEQQSATELHLDLTKPIFSEEQGLFYLHGVTLGDSQSKVIERFGENYVIGHDDHSGADLILDYDGNARFYFYEDKLNKVVFMKVNENYFDQIYNDYDGFKFIFTRYPTDDRFFYSKETSHILHESPESIDGKLYLSLFYASPDNWGNEAEFLLMMEQNLSKYKQHSATKLHLDVTQPTFSEEQGLLYLQGVTLGDSQSKVIERFGENYIIGHEDNTGADFFLQYDGNARFYFYKDKLDRVVFRKVDKNYFDKLFNDSDAFKFISDDDRFFYSKETSHTLKATIIPNGDLHLALYNVWETEEFLKMMEQNVD